MMEEEDLLGSAYLKARPSWPRPDHSGGVISDTPLRWTPTAPWWFTLTALTTLRVTESQWTRGRLSRWSSAASAGDRMGTFTPLPSGSLSGSGAG